MNSSTPTRATATLALLSLAIGSFGIGMTEFMAMGLLPELARDLQPQLWTADRDQAIARAGQLISLYALGVVVGAPTLSTLCARFPRHRALVGLALALTLANAGILVASNFEWAAFTRFLAGLPHGAYFGMAALAAGDILGPGKRGQGVAFTLVGLTVANVVGVPIGTWVGQNWGWHTAFMIVAAVFVLATVMISIFVPRTPADPSRTIRAELAVFRKGRVWAYLATGAIGFSGFFAVYSYVAPLVTEVTGLPQATVPIVVVVMGLGMTVGNLVGGKLADHNLDRALIGSMLAFIVVLAALALTAQWAPSLFAFIFLVGATSSALAPVIQTNLMEAGGDSRSIAASLNHASLNIGNSLGAYVGGVVIAAGLGFYAPAWAGVVLAIVGLAIAATTVIVLRRRRAGTQALS